LFPFAEVAKAILTLLPDMLFNPFSPRFFLFWMFALVVSFQYTRIGETERRIYGQVRNPPSAQTVRAILQGITAGVVGSFLLVFVGVAFTPETNLAPLILLAVLLMLISPRLVCLAYAGGLVSLGHLAFGFPAVNVPALLALVAVLHLVESGLIFLSGARFATPLFIRNAHREVVGGFSLQKFWPVPLVVLFLMTLPPEIVEQGIPMPDWWPLIPVDPGYLEHPGAIFQMLPVVAIMGYGDVAITTTPRRRSRRTAGQLCLYSLTLLGLALLAGRFAPFSWLAAVFAPLGHELVAQRGSRRELAGEPLLAPRDRGVTVLDAMPDSPASRAGLETGDVILSINGLEVHSRREARQAMEISPLALELLVQRIDGRVQMLVLERPPAGGALGMILAPEPGDAPHVEIGQAGMLLRLWRKLRRPTH